MENIEDVCTHGMARTVLIDKNVDRVRDAHCTEGHYDSVHKSGHTHEVNFLWPIIIFDGQEVEIIVSTEKSSHQQ